MCGIFGAVHGERKKLIKLARLSMSRGKDASGVVTYNNGYHVTRSHRPITAILDKIKQSEVVIGHTRLVTNGMGDNQPITVNNRTTVHNGIVINVDTLFEQYGYKRELSIDTEILNHLPTDKLHEYVQGVLNTAIIDHDTGELSLFSNNGSLFYGYIGTGFYFASEHHYLHEIGVNNVHQLINAYHVVSVPKAPIVAISETRSTDDLIPTLPEHLQASKLIYKKHSLKRCTKCILPETMPFISFNSDGICNYCTSYKPRNEPKPVEMLQDKLRTFRRTGYDCIVPLSGGRDSCYGLHYIVKELGLNPIAYTYDWGMVTDLGRRNISRMCEKLGVQHVIVSADIRKKRSNIRKNLQAWLKSPDLGMVSILTAGDKHFFKYIDEVRKNTGVSLNIWSINPLEITHFKAGFLGVEPSTTKNVYISGIAKQLDYQYKRFKAMTKSMGYFNSSLYDTLSGEYYRSINKKVDYVQLFDYVRWDERTINDTLIDLYDWETAPDTNTTWRIGDGTAALYNYIYYTMAGFTEHDTFRSNQIREGDLTRDEALRLVEDENRPRYQNIKWYLNAVGMDFDVVIDRINEFAL